MNNSIPVEVMKQDALKYINKLYDRMKTQPSEDLLDTYVHLKKTEYMWKGKNWASGGSIGLLMVDTPEFKNLLKDMKDEIVRRMGLNRDA